MDRRARVHTYSVCQNGFLVSLLSEGRARRSARAVVLTQETSARAERRALPR